MFDNGFRLDSQLTLAIKAVIQSEETARALSFDIDLGEAAVVEARAALLENFTPEKIQKQLQGSAVRIGKELARRVPSLEAATLSGSTSTTRASSSSRSTPRASRSRSRASATSAARRPSG